MKALVFAVFAASVGVAAAAVETVSDSKGLAKAFERIEKGSPEKKEIVIKSGVYFVEKTLNASSVTSLTIRAEKPGTVEICGGVRITGWKRVLGTPFWAAPAKAADGSNAIFRGLVKNGQWVPVSVLPG